MQAARADVLGLVIHYRGVARDLADGVVGEGQAYAFRREEGHVLRGEGVLRLAQNSLEVGFGEGLELDADGKAALQFGDQIRRLGDVERTGRYEQDVVGL